MTGRDRILTTIRHEEPDRVPISPRVYAYIKANYGDESLETHLKYMPDMDLMFIVENGTVNYLETYPEEYHLPEVEVTQKKYEEDDCIIVERTFHTPAGSLSDRTKIPPSGQEYGMSPNPIKTEYLVKSRDDLEALKYLLPPINKNFDSLHEYQRKIGSKTTIKGYIDLIYVVQKGTPELITETIRNAMEIAKTGGGFIIGSSDSFREGTPKENIETYFRACKQFGKYGV